MTLHEEKSNKIVKPSYRLIYDNYYGSYMHKAPVASHNYIHNADMWNIAEVDNKFGLIDNKGNIIPIEYDSINTTIYYSNSFSSVGSYLLFLVIVKKNNKYGLISIKQQNLFIEYKVLFEPVFDSINKIENFSMFEVVQDNKLGRLDNFGNYIFEPKYEFIYEISLANNFRTDLFFKFKIDNKYGLADYKGNTMLPAIYDEIHDFKLIDDKKIDVYGRMNNDNCIAKVKLNGKYGYVDLNMNTVITPVFDDIHSFKKFKTYTKKSIFLAVVKSDDKYGIIDINEKLVIKPTFYNMKSMVLYESWTKLIFQQDGTNKMAFISNNGDCKIVCDSIEQYESQLFIIKNKENYGLLNKAGDIVLPVKYDYIENHAENMNFIKVGLNNKYGCALLNGELVLDVIYDEITYIFCNKIFARIKLGNEYKLVDSYRNFVVDIIHIKAPTEAQQLEAINYDAHLIKYIKNPIEKVQLQAIKQDANFIRNIDSPTEIAALEAINKNPSLIKYIKNPTEKVQLQAVSYEGSLIKFIDKPCESVLRNVNVKAYLQNEEINLNSNLKYEIPEYEKDEIRYL